MEAASKIVAVIDYSSPPQIYNKRSTIILTILSVSFANDYTIKVQNVDRVKSTCIMSIQLNTAFVRKTEDNKQLREKTSCKDIFSAFVPA